MTPLPPLTPYVPFAIPLEGDEEGLSTLLSKIERDRGFNCQFYKQKCLRRRLAVRMRARGRHTFGEYAALLDEDPAEYEHLLDTLTINVTKFYRNPETWEAFRAQVVPHLFERPGPIRIWSAGAASGEEAYTVNMILHEWAEAHGRTAELARVEIVGTDIDRRSLEAARRGEYPDLSFTDLPPEMRERWFTPGPPLRIRPEAQAGVTFEQRDLISGEPLKGMNLILCRNVVIYFDREIQERLYTAFHDSLVPGGFLVMGKVETLIGEARLRFRPVNNRERIFRKPE
jgi:chemotaxis protein methyltransferase CheR